jgi:tight adherence protein C
MKVLAPLIAIFVALLPLIPVQAQSAPLDIVDVRADGFPRIVVRLRDSPGAVSGLQPDQLRVLENGQGQPSADIQQLRNPAIPTSIALALDVSGSMSDQNKLVAAQTAAKAFITQIRPIDKVALVSFADEVIVPQPLTSDRQLLTRSIDQLTPGGNTSLYDAVAQGLTQLSLSPSGSRALVVLTDGNDTASERQLSDDIAQAVQLAAPIYAIGLGSDADTEVLQQFATESGGHYYSAPTSSDLTDAFRLISHQLGAEYQVSWISNSSITSNSDVPVQISLAHTDGSQSSVDLAYTPPAFAVKTQTAPANPLQVLREIVPAAAPTEQQILIAGALAGLGVLLLVVGVARRRANLKQQSRLLSYVAGQPLTNANQGLTFYRTKLSPMTVTAATLTARLLPNRLLTWLRGRLIQAGYPSDRHLGIFLATELVLAVLLGGLAYVLLQGSAIAARSPSASPLFASLAALLGGYLPYIWLRRRVESRQKSIMRALPDALDLMVISVTAGLSLDTAMAEVVQKWDGDLSRELNQVLNEIRMGVSRRDAFRNLVDRTKIPDIQLLVAAILQADEVGSNISDVLSVQADQLRIRRHHLAEELARKAPIKMLVPMVLLIFPAMFAVVLAPAIIQVHGVLGSFVHHA